MRHVELSVIIVSYKVPDLLTVCLDTLDKACRGIKHEVIVVDNASEDGTVDVIRKTYPSISVIANSENVGFASANNQAYKVTMGRYVLILNPDTIVRECAVRKVLDFMRKTPDAGLAGCRQVGRDGELQKSIHSIHTVWGNLLCAYGIDRILKKEYKKETYYGNKPFAIGYPTGSFMLLRREALCGRDLFNESFFMYSEEPDLAMRLKLNGWLTYYVPSAEIVHVGGGSTSQNREKMFLQLHRSQLYFYRLYYSKQRALLLQLTWGLVILNTWIASFLASFVGLGRIRSDLFGRVLAAYPSMLYETWRAK